MDAPSTAEVGAHAAAVTADLPHVVTLLREALGVGVVARLAGVAETRAVHQWAGGEREVRSASVETRLRIGYQLVQMLSSRWKPSVIATWFHVPNPLLSYRSPLEVLDGQSSVGTPLSASLVVQAARQFVETKNEHVGTGVSMPPSGSHALNN